MLKDVSSIFSHAILYCLKILHSFLTKSAVNRKWIITLHLRFSQMIIYRWDIIYNVLSKIQFSCQNSRCKMCKNCVCNPMSFLSFKDNLDRKKPIPKLQRFISRVACLKDTTNKSSNVKLGFTSCRQRSATAAAVTKCP